MRKERPDAPVHNLNSFFKMMIQRFRTAAQGLGKYCPLKNELRVRKGRKIYCFTCGEQEFRFVSTGQPEVVIPFAPDATVDEFRRSIVSLIGEC